MVLAAELAPDSNGLSAYKTVAVQNGDFAVAITKLIVIAISLSKTALAAIEVWIGPGWVFGCSGLGACVWAVRTCFVGPGFRGTKYIRALPFGTNSHPPTAQPRGAQYGVRCSRGKSAAAVSKCGDRFEAEASQQVEGYQAGNLPQEHDCQGKGDSQEPGPAHCSRGAAVRVHREATDEYHGCDLIGSAVCGNVPAGLVPPPNDPAL